MNDSLHMAMHSTTPLVGRADHIRNVLDALSGGEVRLLTLTGPPGIGKTRLAIEVAKLASDLFPDGVCYVSLAALSSPGLVLPAIAQALGLHVAGAQATPDLLAQFFSEKQMLLVLDNFEHVIGAAGEISSLLAASLNLKAVITSRVRLHIQSEHELPISPLALPNMGGPQADSTDILQAEAVQLFVRRAQAANRLFQVDESNVRAVGELCAYLEGIPLALELAAARTRLLNPLTMLARLRQHGQRFHLLADGATDLPDRQRTLQASIDWSYNLLDVPARRLLSQLAVFRGGWTLDAMETVCNIDLMLGSSAPGNPWNADGIVAASSQDTLLEVLSRLVSSSLVQVEETPDGENRYFMLETIREYAFERLRAGGEAEEVCARHAAYYTGLVEEISTTLEAGTQKPTDWMRLEQLEANIGNLRAALDWTTLQGPASDVGERRQLGLSLAAALWLFWEMRNHVSEGREACERILQLPYFDSRSPERIKVLFALGRLAAFDDDYDSAQKAFEESLDSWRMLEDAWGMSLAYIGLGQCAQSRQDYEAAQAHFDESLRLRRMLNHDWGTASALTSLATVARNQGNAQEAITLLDESLHFARRSGNYWCTTQCLNEKARVLLDTEAYDEAYALLNESLSLGLQMRDKAALCNCVRSAARIAITHNHLSEAVILLSVAELMLELKGIDVARRHVSHDVTHVRSTIGDTQFESLWNEGRRMPLEHLVPIFETIAAPAETGVEHQAALQHLTSRELEVLRLLAQGLTSMEIAGTLSVSPNTVSTHIRSIFSKLGVNTRSAATRYALTHGLA